MEDLIRLEKEGWQALSSTEDKAKKFYNSLLADNAVMVFPGDTMLKGKKQILKFIGVQPWKSFKIEEPLTISLSKDAEVVIYKVTAQRDGSTPYIALVSSTYTFRNEAWKLIFHQQTLV